MLQIIENFKNLFFKIISLILFIFSFSVGSATKVNKGLDFITLSEGIQYDYKLPKSYSSKKLKFEGTYTKYSSISYLKLKNLIRFTPKRIGTGVVIIKEGDKNKILKKLNIDVRKTNLHKIAKEISDLLITIDGITIKILNNKVVIDGQILLPRDMDRIQSVLNEYKSTNLVSSLVSFSPAAQNQIQKLIEKKIGNPEITVEAAYNRFILRGWVHEIEEKNRAETIANFYTQYDYAGAGYAAQAVNRKQIPSVSNLIRVREKKQAPPPDDRKKLVQIAVHYVELKKDFNKGFLFQWTPTIDSGQTQITAQGGSAATNLFSTLTATVSNLFPKLNWAKSFGFARVLHNSNILVEDGTSGSIDVKTQIPTTTIDNQQAVTTTTEAGITASITPTIIGPRKDTVRLKINFNVKSVIGRSSSGAITSSKTVNTSIYTRSGLSAAVGGLISSSISKDYNRLPTSGVDGGTPIVNLVSAKNYDSARSQFVVFITPSIRSSASVGVNSIKEKFKVEQN